jgi:hypothetical protein
MSEKFIVAAFQNNDPPATPFATRDDALVHVRSLFDERGTNLEIAIFINWLSPADIWLGPEKLREWYRAGCPPVS